jgi:hypothetical protein
MRLRILQSSIKNSKKTRFLLFCDFFMTLSLKNDGNVSVFWIRIRISRIRMFLGLRIRIRIRYSEVQIRGSGSVSGYVPKCHGSAPLQASTAPRPHCRRWRGIHPARPLHSAGDGERCTLHVHALIHPTVHVHTGVGEEGYKHTSCASLHCRWWRRIKPGRPVRGDKGFTMHAHTALYPIASPCYWLRKEIQPTRQK